MKIVQFVAVERVKLKLQSFLKAQNVAPFTENHAEISAYLRSYYKPAMRFFLKIGAFNENNQQRLTNIVKKSHHSVLNMPLEIMTN